MPQRDGERHRDARCVAEFRRQLGHDTLNEGDGNDAYLFNEATGTESDTLAETNSLNSGSDLLDFSALSHKVVLKVELKKDAALPEIKTVI